MAYSSEGEQSLLKNGETERRKVTCLKYFPLIVLPDIILFFLFNNFRDFNSFTAITHFSHLFLLVNTKH